MRIRSLSLLLLPLLGWLAPVLLGIGPAAATGSAGFLALLTLVDTEELLSGLADHSGHLLKLSGLLALLVSLPQTLQRLLSRVLVAGGLSLHHLSDALSEGLGQLLCSAALLSSLSPRGLLRFTAETELVALGSALKTLSLTGCANRTGCSAAGSELLGLKTLNSADCHIFRCTSLSLSAVKLSIVVHQRRDRGVYCIPVNKMNKLLTSGDAGLQVRLQSKSRASPNCDRTPWLQHSSVVEQICVKA